MSDKVKMSVSCVKCGKHAIDWRDTLEQEHWAHREETIRRTVEYNRLNPDKHAQYQRTYRARKKAEALEQERKELRPNA